MAKPSKAAKTTTTFPKVGNNIAATVGSSQSVKPQRGTLVRKTGNAKGGMLEPATARNRAQVQERLGFKGAPQTKTSYMTAQEAALTQRNTLIVRSAVGNRDFYDARARSQAF